MSKNNNNWIWIVIGIVAFFLIIGKGGNNIFNITNQQPNTPTPDKVIEYSSYSVTLDLNPQSICTGATTKGTINSNIKNGVCSIFVKPSSGVWTLFGNVNLNANGYYSANSPVINTAGIADFTAICCDSNRNCKMSNQITLTVNTCAPDTDGDGIPDTADPDDDNDGYSDEEENEAGTNPLDSNSHPTYGNCPNLCDDIGFDTGREVTSPGYCNAPEIYHDFGTRKCCCTPRSDGIPDTYSCGVGATAGAMCMGGTCPISYTCEVINSLSTGREWCACVNNQGEVNVDWKPEGDMYNPFPIESFCFDTDNQDLLTVGNCEDNTHVGGILDTCYSMGYVHEWNCQNSICVATNMPCANNYLCVAGQCIIDGNLEGQWNNWCNNHAYTQHSLSGGVINTVANAHGGCMTYTDSLCAPGVVGSMVDEGITPGNDPFTSCCMWKCY